MSINAVLPRHAPINGNTLWASDNNSARIKAIWPSSGVMGESQGETERSHRWTWHQPQAHQRGVVSGAAVAGIGFPRWPSAIASFNSFGM